MSSTHLFACVGAVVLAGCSGPGGGSGGGGTGGGAGGGGGADGGALKCGNGTLETDEICEGFELRGETCVSKGFDVGQLRCSSGCALDFAGCSKCGDGKISGLERCDSDAFGGKTCVSELDAGALGDLSCLDACTRISTASCRFPPGRNEQCALLGGCAAGLVCDLVTVSTATFRCRPHCDLAGAGTALGCAASELCTDGTVELQGATASPPVLVTCPADGGCATGFSCVDAGITPSFCYKRAGYCQ